MARASSLLERLIYVLFGGHRRLPNRIIANVRILRFDQAGEIIDKCFEEFDAFRNADTTSNLHFFVVNRPRTPPIRTVGRQIV